VKHDVSEIAGLGQRKKRAMSGTVNESDDRCARCADHAE